MLDRQTLIDHIMTNPIGGKPCIKCGAMDRGNHGQCRPCAKATAYAWAAANKDRAKENRDKWQAANRIKLAEQSAAWRAANPEKAKSIRETWANNNPGKAEESSLKWRGLNREKIRVAAVAYRVANPEKSIASVMKWYAKNPESRRIHAHNRRARALEAGGQLSNGLAQKLFKLQKGKCPCCAQPLGENYHLDHKMPLALGGTNTDDNMQLLRQRCNNQKHAKHPVDFMQERGFLL